MADKTFGTVYISGALQGARDLALARSRYERLATTCASEGWAPYVPHQNTDPQVHRDHSARDVFEKDLSAVQNADLIVAFIGEPSLGVGAELGIAFSMDIRVIALRSREDRSSRFLEGMLEASENVVVVYDDLADCDRQLARCLIQMRPVPASS